MKFSSLAAPEVVQMTTFNASRYEISLKWWHFRFKMLINLMYFPFSFQSMAAINQKNRLAPPAPRPHSPWGVSCRPAPSPRTRRAQSRPETHKVRDVYARPRKPPPCRIPACHVTRHVAQVTPHGMTGVVLKEKYQILQSSMQTGVLFLITSEPAVMSHERHVMAYI